jgi:AAA domain, putative AbiEii toxin, Type IV TA system/AAA ATPase domain
MRIKSATVKNYKSFPASQTTRVVFSSGINVIVGQNNAGKTALLEALSLRPKNIQHRSLSTHPRPDAVVPDAPIVGAEFVFEPQEVLELLADGRSPFAIRVENHDDAVMRWRNLLAREVSLAVMVDVSKGISATIQDAPQEAGLGRRYFELTRPHFHLSEASQKSGGPVADHLATLAQGQVYLFGAERYSLGTSAFGNQPHLSPNAQNLPEVLNHLQRNPAQCRRFNELVCWVLPQVQWISVEPADNAQLRILVWSVDPACERPDIAVPLADSGTGIGQVLAILFVILTAHRPKVIVIDEPQTFLHPGAVRKLFEIFREYSMHQFIVSTHSPVAIASAEPDSITLVRCINGVSEVHSVQRAEAKELRTVLWELGARLEDVFGADRILWVEGKTEEATFPVIVRGVMRRPLAGMAIVGVVATGDFDARRSRGLALQIYHRLSQKCALLPTNVAFVFDRETRDENEIATVERESSGRVAFLPRRTFENYLLVPEAIAAVASAIEGFGFVTAAEVQGWLDEHRWDPALFEPRRVPADHSDEAWAVGVSGAAVMEALFTALSETRVTYGKVQHGLALTEWLVAHQPDRFSEVTELIARLMPDEHT